MRPYVRKEKLVNRLNTDTRNNTVVFFKVKLTLLIMTDRLNIDTRNNTIVLFKVKLTLLKTDYDVKLLSFLYRKTCAMHVQKKKSICY